MAKEVARLRDEPHNLRERRDLEKGSFVLQQTAARAKHQERR